MENDKNQKFECPIDFSLNIISGKWKFAIIWELGLGTKRFNELDRLFPPISRKVLAEQLKELEQYQIIDRKVYAEIPPKVEYSLTEQGKELFPIFDAIYKWGEKQMAFLNACEDEETEI